MFPLQLQGHCGLGQRVPSMQFMKNVGHSTMTSSRATTPAAADDKHTKSTTEACKSHKEAERRRRQRINAHLSTLRSLLPNTIKTDKASLLAEVVNHVKELRKQAAEIYFARTGPVDSFLIPGELDEATLNKANNGDKALIKATVCCEDRPGLNRDIGEAIRAVRAKAIRAEMMTIGGRTKSVVGMQWAEDEDCEENVGVLKRALKAVVENRGSVYGLQSKRARFCGGYEGLNRGPVG